MLVNLHVKNFAIIDEVDVYFNDHLNILTGETGAGKSIILGSVNIALGGKVNKEMIRKGADYALVELCFAVDDVHTIQALEAMDIVVEDGQILISRKIMNGRTINKINGENVPTVMLKQVAGFLLDIHGQHEHQSLLYKTKHLSIVDRYAKVEVGDLKKELQQLYKSYQNLKREMESSYISEDQRLREISFLEYEINEIENARIKPQEEEQLYETFKKMSNANTISDSLATVYEIMGSGNDSLSDELSRAIRSMSKVCEMDESLRNFNTQLMEIEGLVTDFNRDVSDYMSNLEFDPSEYQRIDERLSLIHQLKAKYGNSVEEIQEYLEEAKEKLARYEEYERYLESLNQKKDKLEQELEKVSEQISKNRKSKAKELTQKIIDALLDLNFMNVQFDISIKRMDRYTEQGFDDVEFMISTNLGEDMRPLAKVASGGELSRIMLAIKSVLADQDAVDTLIFDEIDVGISGRTAQKVSERMALIARNHQVLCITHLPQISAMADSHYIIEKIGENNRTSTNIRLLEEKESIEEIARILGGAMITDAVIQNASEMKELAREVKEYN